MSTEALLLTIQLATKKPDFSQLESPKETQVLVQRIREERDRFIGDNKEVLEAANTICGEKAPPGSDSSYFHLSSQCMNTLRNGNPKGSMREGAKVTDAEINNRIQRLRESERILGGDGTDRFDPNYNQRKNGTKR